MAGLNDAELVELLKRFRKAWVSRGWSWDRRFDCLASTFDVAHQTEARAAVDACFSFEFTKATIGKAPKVIQDVADNTGGVRSDQHLFVTKAFDNCVAVGLWWPWGGEGTNISMRVLLAGRHDMNDMFTLRELFGALDD